MKPHRKEIDSTPRGKSGALRSGRTSLRPVAGGSDSWKLGLFLTATVVVVTWLTFPRPVPPSVIPQPQVDMVVDARSRAAEAELRAEALAGLPLEVRGVGERLRRYGALEAAAAGAKELAAAQARLRRFTRAAAEQHGGRPLLALRALQTQLFVGEVERWRGSASDELRELGGGFVRVALGSGWLTQTGDVQLLPSETASLFQMRWGGLTGLNVASGFSPRANDWRRYHAVRLRYPEQGVHLGRSERLMRQLESVEALGRLDPTYPADFAKGVLLYQLGAEAQALTSFRTHLTRNPDGAWSLWARNHAAAAAKASLQ